MKRIGSAVWNGGIKTGDGKVSTESGVLDGVPYSFAKRFGDAKGSNPEELIGAAHAACFSMALSGVLDAQEMTEEERQMANAFMSSMDMALIFDAGGTMRMEASLFGEVQTATGTWSGVKQGELIVIDSTTSDGTEPPETSIMEIDFASSDMFAAREVGSDERMYFTRRP